MALRPARTIRELERPYTRVAKRVAKKNFIPGAPDPRVRMFDMGNLKPENAQYVLDLVCPVDIQLRDNALEAARIAANRYLEKQVGKENFHLKLRVYPHHVIREHSFISGAGADRLSQGMRKPFGRPKGRAAQLTKGDKILTAYVKESGVDKAKEALRRACSKFPFSPVIRVTKLN